MSRKLVYYVAMSVDHYIAHPDGSVGGMPMEGEHVWDYLRSLRDYDTVLMGKNTYEFGYQYGVKPGDPSPTYGHMMQYVFSQSMDEYDHPQLKVIREDAPSFVKGLKAQDGGAIYLSGGGQLAGSLLEAGLIDELIIKLNPVVFGSGIPLFGESQFGFDLTMINTKVYANGLVFIHYRVEQ